MKEVSNWKWVALNLKIGALSFGSSGRALLYQKAIVDENRWLSDDEFREVFTLTQVLPGPNLVNLSVYLGFRLSGLMGTALGLLALALPGAVMLVAAYHLLGFARTPLEPFFKGVSIGSVLLFFVLVAKNAQGFGQSAHFSKGVPRFKRLSRFAVAIVVGGFAMSGVSLSLLLPLGALAGIALEFIYVE